MGRLVIDNWTLEKAVHSYETVFTSQTVYNNELVNFIESIVLWDELFYWKNDKEIVWTTRKEVAVSSFLSVLDCVCFNDESYNSLLDNAGVRERGAVSYYNACNNNDYGYLAVEERAEFLRQYYSNHQTPDRQAVLKYFDHKICEKYQNIVSILNNQPIRFSSIFNRVLKGARNPQELIQSATELRNSSDARRFRQYIDVIEHEDIDNLNKHLLSLLENINRLFKDDDGVYTTEITLNWGWGSAALRGSPRALIPNEFFCNRRLNFFKVLHNNIKSDTVIGSK